MGINIEVIRQKESSSKNTSRSSSRPIEHPTFWISWVNAPTTLDCSCENFFHLRTALTKYQVEHVGVRVVRIFVRTSKHSSQ